MTGSFGIRTNNFRVAVLATYLTNNSIIRPHFPDNLPNKIKSIIQNIVIHHVRKHTKNRINY